MADKEAITEQSHKFLTNVQSHTQYEQAVVQEAEQVFSELHDKLTTITGSPEGNKLIQKYTVLATTISTEGTFIDMIKIIWRMVKAMSGDGKHKLVLMVLGIGTIVHAIAKNKGSTVVQPWVGKVEMWLGQQLTIGGKGVTGDGDGSVSDRIRRFFSTPYLHDFD